MLYSIVDLGSNTIRMNVYEVKHHQANILFSKKETAGIVSYVKKGVMNESGIALICKILSEYQRLSALLSIDGFYVFSTASLRNIKNTSEVLKKVKEETGIHIEVLSGETEGKMSFYGATLHLDFTDGVLIDVGGGSSEIVIYQNRCIKEVYSLPVGSLNMFNRYVSKLIPKENEKEKIIKQVRSELAKLPIQTTHRKHMCAVGGTMRTIRQILQNTNLLALDEEIIPSKMLHELDEHLEKGNKEAIRTILHAKPDRIHTLIPGLLIIMTLADYFSAEDLQVSQYGVREGYLYQRVLGESYE